MNNDSQSIPETVLHEAQTGVEKAQSQGLSPIEHFVETDKKTNQQYLFVLSSDRNSALIDSVPQGMALIGNDQKKDIPPTYGERIGVVQLAQLPYVVFRVVEGYPK